MMKRISLLLAGLMAPHGSPAVAAEPLPAPANLHALHVSDTVPPTLGFRGTSSGPTFQPPTGFTAAGAPGTQG